MAGDTGRRERMLGAVEGYYGEPLTHEARVDLVEWLGARGYDCYGYAPKNDPYHRDRWRDPYPEEAMARFRELIAVGEACGARVAMGISPGLDWRDGDETPLIAKLASFRDIGARDLAIAFDDVPPGGAELGARHGAAVAAAVEALGGDGRWICCPTDYATPVVTPYLRALVDALPREVLVLWTGPSIVTPRLAEGDVAAFAAELGRPPLFGENFPVNDGGMEGVLHLGPYPDREPAVVDHTTGVLCNFMRHPIASRIGLAAAARFWLDPARDREEAWRECLAELPGIEPLARACRSWAQTGEPDAELLEWAAAALDGGDTRLLTFLQAGCRAGLDPALAAEVEPWLEQWDRQSYAMQYALKLLGERPSRPASTAFAVTALWQRARERPEQTFGVRWAAYPVTTWDGEVQALPQGVLRGENLCDRLCAAALGLTDRLH